MLSKFYLISSCSLLSNLVWAQTSDPTSSLPTIVIQAKETDQNVITTSASTKFTHDVLDTPSSRSFLSQEILKQQDMQRIDDALNQVSGVFSQTNYGGGFWDNFSFRGFSTDPNIGPQIIRNGLSVNRGLSASRDMVNIESLEFLKGPMAALYGRGETGGLLNINTKKTGMGII